MGLMMLLVPPFARSADSPELTELLKKGQTAIQVTNWHEAKPIFEKAVSLDPKNEEAQLSLGRCLYHIGEYESALERAKIVVELDPTNSMAIHLLGGCYYDLTNYTDAADAYTKWTSLEPTNFFSWFWLGRSLLSCSLTNYSGATDAFRKCAAIEPTNYYAWYWLGRSLTFDRHNEEAVAAFESALKIKPDDFFGHYHLAHAFWQLNSNDTAVAEFQAAGRLRPKDFESHYNSGLILAGLQRFPEAVPELEKAHDISPNNKSAKIILAAALLLTSEYRKATALFPTVFAVLGGGLGLSYACGLFALLAMSFKKRAATAPGFIFSFSWMFLFFEGQIAGVLLAGIFLPAYKMAVMLNAALWVCALPIAFAAFAGFPRQPWGEPFLLRFPPLKTVGFCILAAIFLGIFDFTFEQAAGWLLGKPLSDQMIVPFLKEAFTDAPWITAIAIIVLSPVAEEILFRGLLYGALARRLKPLWVIVITSALFALVHMELIFFVPLFVVGLVLGYARHKTGSLTASILIHGINNGLAFLALKLCSGC